MFTFVDDANIIRAVARLHPSYTLTKISHSRMGVVTVIDPHEGKIVTTRFEDCHCYKCTLTSPHETFGKCFYFWTVKKQEGTFTLNSVDDFVFAVGSLEFTPCV